MARKKSGGALDIANRNKRKAAEAKKARDKKLAEEAAALRSESKEMAVKPVEIAVLVEEPKRGPGRPRKYPVSSSVQHVGPKRGRGRPPKIPVSLSQGHIVPVKIEMPARVLTPVERINSGDIASWMNDIEAVEQFVAEMQPTPPVRMGSSHHHIAHHHAPRSPSYPPHSASVPRLSDIPHISPSSRPSAIPGGPGPIDDDGQSREHLPLKKVFTTNSGTAAQKWFAIHSGREGGSFVNSVHRISEERYKDLRKKLTARRRAAKKAKKPAKKTAKKSAAPKKRVERGCKKIRRVSYTDVDPAKKRRTYIGHCADDKSKHITRTEYAILRGAPFNVRGPALPSKPKKVAKPLKKRCTKKDEIKRVSYVDLDEENKRRKYLAHCSKTTSRGITRGDYSLLRSAGSKGRPLPPLRKPQPRVACKDIVKVTYSHIDPETKRRKYYGWCSKGSKKLISKGKYAELLASGIEGRPLPKKKVAKSAKSGKKSAKKGKKSVKKGSEESGVLGLGFMGL